MSLSLTNEKKLVTFDNIQHYHNKFSQVVDGKQDSLVSGSNIKTINGQSIVGSGDITISGGSSDANVQAVDTGDVLDDVAVEYVTKAYFDSVVGDINSVLESIIGGSSSGGSSSGGSGAYAYVNHGTSDTTFELTPNTFHVWDEVTSLNITLGAETSGIANEYLFQFISGSTPTTLTLPSDIKFSEDLVIEANKVYQISILKGLGSVLEWDSGVTLIENKATYNEINATVTFQYPVASDLIVEVGMDPINISAGEQSGTIVGVPEPGAEIKSITPISDSTYYYTF